MGSADLMLPLVYIDTNVFISALEGPGAVSDHAWWILEAIEGGEILGVTSEITLAEVLVHPLRRKDDALIESYTAMISPSSTFAVIPVGRDILVAAAQLRADHASLRLPDAIHLASALQTGAGHFVSRDVQLATIAPIHVVDGGPFSLDLIREAHP